MNNLQEQNDNIENDNQVLPSQNTETAALTYASAGLSVLPLVLPEKSPVIKHWTPLQSAIASQEEIKSWFSQPNVQVGIICGKVSGNLELLDFDEKHNIENTSLFDRFKKAVQEIAPALIEKLVVEKTVSNGYHAVYKCDTIEHNQKLSRRPATSDEVEAAKKEGKNAGVMTLIETRGEGGYFMCAPSAGYDLIQGSFDKISTITVDERNILLNCARSLNELVESSEIVNTPSNLDRFVKRPGDDFNQRGEIRSILREGGWKMVGKHDKGEYWRRPGKTIGVSASLTFGKKNSIPYFTVYSTNAHPLSDKHHSYFSVYTYLKHNGNWSDAAKAIEKEGFGSTTISEAEEYLEVRYEFRLNLITQKTEYREIGKKEYVEINDINLNSLYRELQKFHIKIGLDRLAGLLHSDFVTAYDPFIEYYETLPAWDVKRDYIEEVARTLTLSDQTEYDTFKEHFTKWLVNAVGCAIVPSVANHNALILVGAQGRYKTTWLNRLVPSKLNQYKFIGTINPDNKDTLIHLSECLLVNLDELETLKKSDIGSLKSVMTLQHIHVRRPYGRIAENLIRRASFVGSINKREFLNDETGTRRFLTYEIESIDLNKPVDIDGMHAQAYHLWKQGYRYWFDSAAIESVNERNSKFAIRSTEDELIPKMITPASEADINSGSCKWKTATDIAIYAKNMYGYAVNPNSAKNFGIALNKAGFTSKRTGNGKTYAIMVIPGMQLAESEITGNQAAPSEQQVAV